MQINEIFDIQFTSLTESILAQKKKLEALKQDLTIAKDENNKYKVMKTTRKINNILNQILSLESKRKNMRIPIASDVMERNNLMVTYSKLVNDAIPDGIPLVFHGNSRIGVIEEIISSGGLKTPDERDVDYSSFAAQIDVTTKENITTALQFAEPGGHFFDPYGAIFVFWPKEKEFEKVLKTGMSSEVPDGVEGIDFQKEPERLFAIITTSENTERLKKCCMKNSLNSNIIMSHEDFLDYCRIKFKAEKIK